MEQSEFAVFNDDAALRTQPRTIVCTGIGRSGTSAVISLVEYLGIFVTKSPGSAANEDKQLAQMIATDQKLAKARIRELDELYPVWAFKSPSLRSRMRKVFGMMRNPFLIVPHRDVLGVALRNEIAGVEAISNDTMMKQFEQVEEGLQAYAKLSIPQLHLSFNLIQNDVHEAARQIARFIGVDANLDELDAFMEAKRKRYIEVDQAAERSLEERRALKLKRKIQRNKFRAKAAARDMTEEQFARKIARKKARKLAKNLQASQPSQKGRP